MPDNRKERGSQIISQYLRLQTARAPHNKTYQEAYSFTYPVRGAAFSTASNDGNLNASTAKTQKAVLYDSTATESVRLLASSILSSLTPSALKWFGLDLADGDVESEDLPQEIAEWLEEAAEKLHQLIHASNYDGIALEFFTDVVIAGMAGLYIELNREGKLQFQLWPLYSMFCQDTYKTGRLDTIYRILQLTAAQAVEKFGVKNVSEAIREQNQSDPYSLKTFEFVHVVRPRIKPNGSQASGKLKTNMPFESVYVDYKSKEIALESGYEELPVVVPRWMQVPDTDIAFGPVYDALPDIKTLNRVGEMLLQAAEISISGLWKATNDGVFNPNTTKVGAGKIVVVSDMNNFVAITPAADVKFAVNEIARLQAQIRRALLADQLGPAEKQNMTATEIATRTQIIRQVLGPIFSRLQAEYLDPLITRCFGLMIRANKLGTPPDSLKGKIFDIVYRTPLARDQRRADIEAMSSIENTLSLAAQANNPALADNYDMDAAFRKRANLLGVDVSLLRSEVEVRKMRKDRQNAQAATAQQQQAAQVAQQQTAEAQGEQ